jgi:quercetin dioxygenase-like cupin family protein
MTHEPFEGMPSSSTMTRRSLMEAAGALLLFASASSGQTPPGAAAAGSRRQVFQHDLPDLTLKDWSVTVIEVRYAPGQESQPHRHPGLTFAYVLEGEVVSKIGDDPERTYKTGEMFMETPNQLHAVSRNASSTQPARLLALLLAEKGATLTTPAK